MSVRCCWVQPSQVWLPWETRVVSSGERPKREMLQPAMVSGVETTMNCEVPLAYTSPVYRKLALQLGRLSLTG